MAVVPLAHRRNIISHNHVQLSLDGVSTRTLPQNFKAEHMNYRTAPTSASESIQILAVACLEVRVEMDSLGAYTSHMQL